MKMGKTKTKTSYIDNDMAREERFELAKIFSLKSFQLSLMKLQIF